MYRSLSAEGLEDFKAVAATKFWEKFQADGGVVATELVEGTADLPETMVRQSAGVLKHERIPFVSYPYEWPFSMLKDAALLQLDLNLAALEEDMILKDSSPYNVQFKGSKPVFVDVGSFERLREGEPWIGYRQFCMLYLYPLLLQSVKDFDPRALLRGNIDGITPAQMRGLVSFRDRFRKGFYLNVFLHAKLEAKHGDRGKEVKAEVKKAGFKKELIVANVRRMRKLIEGLEWNPPPGVWVAYGERNSYTDDDAKRKDEFVREVVHLAALGPDLGHRLQQRPLLAHRRRGLGPRDVGGLRPGPDRAAAPHAARGGRREDPHAHDEPGRPVAGPRLARRRAQAALADRGKPDLLLALALIHHVDDRGQRAGPGVRGLARLARHRRW